ncbi:MAG: hypothetical protein BMS9Abin31_0260 [Gammaproteobacteria bacterium]|nr:MAG: hypothetical protein BMS9Abin31_0260 [Gammaproteobacteria bacterium]
MLILVDKMNKFRFIRVLIFFVLLATYFSSTVHAENKPENSKGNNITRAFFTTGMLNSEPVNRLLVGSKLKNVYFFTDLRHMEGQTIYHRWEYEGKVISKVKFNIKNSRWRIFSNVKVKPDMIGKWTVVVTDERGWPLKAVIFHYVERRSETDYPDVILPPDRP